MDGKHIAVITLLEKTEELLDRKRALEAEKQELERSIKEAALQISDLRTAINFLQTGLDQRPNGRQPFLKRAEAVGSTQTSSVKTEEKTNFDAYPFDGTLRDKIVYILHQQKRFLHSREIAEYIAAHEPEVEVEKILELISKQVARYKRHGVITSIAEETGRYMFYGLPEWLDEDKQPVRGYEYLYTSTKKKGGV